MPWQQYTADVLGEMNPDGSLVYGEGNLLVGRQEGKTEWDLAENVHRVTAMVLSHGPQRVTFTMQSRKKARMRLERDYATRLRGGRGFAEIDAKSRQRPRRQTEWRLGMNSGVEAIQFGPASYIQIDTPSRTDGHGDTIGRGSIDEAFAHVDNTVEIGMEPAMLTVTDSQLMVLSAAGDVRSEYLWGKVLRGRKMVEAGADQGLAYFEWSGQYGEDDPSDPAVWRRCCPALGFTVTEAKLEALWRKAKEGGQDDIDAFCRSYLCMWPEVPVLGASSAEAAIDSTLWADLVDIEDFRPTPVAFSVEVSEDRKWSSIGLAGRRSDGRTHLQIVQAQRGTGWVVPRVVELAKGWKPVGVVVRPGGAAGSLAASLEAAGVTVVRASPRDEAAATGLFLDGLDEDGIRHDGQRQVAVSIGAARKHATATAGANVLVSSDSSVDIAPLKALVMAMFGLAKGGKPKRTGKVW